MEQHKMRTYLFYAIGEILLVVIGILIAVQVNLALENSRNNHTRQKMIDGLITEFSLNKMQIDTVIQYNYDIIVSGNELIDLIADRRNGIPESIINELLIRNSWLWTYDPLNGVLKSSISSGDIHLLKNDSLKVMLFAWESMVIDAREEQMRALKHYEERMMPFLEIHIPVANIASPIFGYAVPITSFSGDYRSLVFDPQLENNLVNRVIYTNDALIELQPLSEVIDEILVLLEDEK